MLIKGAIHKEEITIVDLRMHNIYTQLHQTCKTEIKNTDRH
jgi:hypothetical protein